MDIQSISVENQIEFNKMCDHPLQSFEWGEFREKTGIKVIRRGFFDPSASSGQGKLIEGFQLTIHKVPHTPWNIGYLPKGGKPTKEIIEELVKIGREENCIFMQLEPNIVRNQESGIRNQEDNEFETIIHNSKFIIQPSAHPLFTKYTMVLDLTQSEEELLKNMHSKTRYNIRVAEKHGVLVKEDNSEKAFEQYLKLTKETTSRQGFFAHTEKYHRFMWETLRRQIANGKPARNTSQSEVGRSQMDNDPVIARSETTKQSDKNNQLTAHLLTATYQGKILVTWIVFMFHDTLYYPYGASSSENREVMASPLMMWEMIKYGKKLGLKKFDMWGALGPDPDPKDPWHGFHRFKQGFNPELVEFVGSYDLVINPLLYQIYKVADKIRWTFLALKKFSI